MEEDKEIEELHKMVFLKLVRREQMTVFFLSIAFFSILIWYINYIFQIAIFEYNVSTIISLGAIMSTFGSSLLAAAQAIGADKYDRVLRNIDIYYNDIVMKKPWRRWQFLNRTSKFKNFNSTIITTTLQNPSEKFDVGSHEIEVYIPTVLEDFYDLPTYYCYNPPVPVTVSEVAEVVNKFML
ncbi:hypothetical protein [Acidaminobacter hydrogenoformans]|uniref:Uncharacterized protein n=1 Tax=Acidaminobacter hydrogenoformans DSM 2784 TaxID=1120920 RepID=A0A1G5S8S6_9FIRM|nr:hypothetical protein [Acidaminobacter hydrogenoformans]SCZ82121.1 hypothetical protein SAMN03080599_03390 [Acidaminobacter hydrogenoformans DSM 2784]